MSDSHDHHGFAHVMSPAVLLAVFAALIVFTVITVLIAGSSLIPPGFDIYVALTIATIKAALVVLFFMHMIHDKGLNAIMFVFSLVFVALFLGAAISDTEQYQHLIKDFGQANPDSMAK
ncbi:MAG: cytochrome C oxidase subunit IV family protein [Planctomycetaceae bacterium]|nr:cytochrome C oxidase subunit IV family protein [Planctomycetaceae bacterium]